LVAVDSSKLVHCVLDDTPPRSTRVTMQGRKGVFGRFWIRPTCLLLDPDGDHVTCGTDGSGVVERRRPDGSLVRELAGPSRSGASSSIAAREADDLLVIRGGYLQRWRDGVEKWQVDVPPASHVALSPGGLPIIAGHGGVDQRYWSGAIINKITDEVAYAVAASRHLIIVAHRETVAIAAPERPAHRLLRPLATSAVPTAVTTDRSGTAFAVGHADGSAAVWASANLTTPAALFYPSPVRAIALTPAGDRLAIGYDDGTLRWWDRL
jgi:WD40 repeat protein